MGKFRLAFGAALYSFFVSTAGFALTGVDNYVFWGFVVGLVILLVMWQGG